MAYENYDDQALLDAYQLQHEYGRIQTLSPHQRKRFWVYKACSVMDASRNAEYSSAGNTTFVWGLLPVLNPSAKDKQNLWDFAIQSQLRRQAEGLMGDDLAYTEARYTQEYSLEIDYPNGLFDFDKGIYVLTAHDPAVQINADGIDVSPHGAFDNRGYNPFDTLVMTKLNTNQNLTDDSAYKTANLEFQSLSMLALGTNSRILLQTYGNGGDGSPVFDRVTGVSLLSENEPVLLSAVRMDGIDSAGTLRQNVKASTEAFPAKVSIPLLENGKANVQFDVADPRRFYSLLKSIHLVGSDGRLNLERQKVINFPQFTGTSQDPSAFPVINLAKLDFDLVRDGVRTHVNHVFQDGESSWVLPGVLTANLIPERITVETDPAFRRDGNALLNVLFYYVREFATVWQDQTVYASNLLVGYSLADLVTNTAVADLVSNILIICYTINNNFYGADNVAFITGGASGQSYKTISSYLKEQLDDKDAKGKAEWINNYFSQGIALIQQGRQYRSFLAGNTYTAPQNDIVAYGGKAPTQDQINEATSLFAMVSDVARIVFAYENGGPLVEWHKVNAPYYLKVSNQMTLNGSNWLWQPPSTGFTFTPASKYVDFPDLGTHTVSKDVIGDYAPFARNARSFGAAYGAMDQTMAFWYVTQAVADTWAAIKPQSWFRSQMVDRSNSLGYYTQADDYINTVSGTSLTTYVTGVVNDSSMGLPTRDFYDYRERIGENLSVITDLGYVLDRGVLLVAQGTDNPYFAGEYGIRTINYRYFIQELPMREQIRALVEEKRAQGFTVTDFRYSFRSVYGNDMTKNGGLLGEACLFLRNPSYSVTFARTAGPLLSYVLKDEIRLRTEPTYINGDYGFYMLSPVSAGVQTQKHYPKLGDKPVEDLENYFVWIPKTATANYPLFVTKLIDSTKLTINNYELNDYYRERSNYDLAVEDPVASIRRITLRHLFGGRVSLVFTGTKNGLPASLSVSPGIAGYVRYSHLVLGNIGDESVGETNIRL